MTATVEVPYFDWMRSPPPTPATKAAKTAVAASDRRPPAPTKLGQMVKLSREAKGLTQQRLGDLAGINGSYVNMLEHGRRGSQIPRDTVLALAQALRSDPFPLLEAAGMLEPGDRPRGKPAASTEATIKADPRLRADQKAALLATYRAFLGG